MLSVEPATALIISIIMVLVLIFRRVNVAVALAAGSALFGILSLGPAALQSLPRAFGPSMIQTLLALILAMILAELYSLVGASEKLVKGLSLFGSKFAAFSTPAIIGLLPMPGGAYVSATVVNPLYEKLGLAAEHKTFINYWFRHIWIATWPLYQGVILASGLLGVSVGKISAINLPIMLAAILVGVIAGLMLIRGSGGGESRGGRGDSSGLLHVWPFVLIAVTALALHLDLTISLAIVVLSAIIAYRPPLKILKRALKYSLNPTFIAIIVLSFIYSEFIEDSGVAHSLAAKFSQFVGLAAFAIPFLVVIGTGVEFTFVALAFPPLAPILKSSEEALLLAFTGGFAGALLSPAHACLVFSSQYYEADIPRVYRVLAPSTAATALAAIILGVIL